MAGRGEEARISAVKTSDSRTLARPWALTRPDNGNYPRGNVGLQALMTKPRDAMNWHGPYMEKEIPLDPWGKPYIYQCPGRHNPCRLRSFHATGPDGTVLWKLDGKKHGKNRRCAGFTFGRTDSGHDDHGCHHQLGGAFLERLLSGGAGWTTRRLRFLALTRYGQSRAINEGVPGRTLGQLQEWLLRAGGIVGLHGDADYTAQTYNVDSLPSRSRCRRLPLCWCIPITGRSPRPNLAQ